MNITDISIYFSSKGLTPMIPPKLLTFSPMKLQKLLGRYNATLLLTDMLKKEGFEGVNHVAEKNFLELKKDIKQALIKLN